MSYRTHVAVALSLLAVGAGCTAPANPITTTSQPATAVIAPVEPPAGAPPATAPTPAPAPSPRKATVSLKAIGDWKQSGTVTLTDLPGNQTKIDISLGGTAPKVTQPAAIYAGTCATQSAEVQYPLNPVVNGKSSTTLDVNITAILDKTAQALKVRRDPVDGKLPYAVCGELK